MSVITICVYDYFLGSSDSDSCETLTRENVFSLNNKSTYFLDEISTLSHGKY